MKLKIFKKRKYESHIHCIICSYSMDTTNWDDNPKEFICGRCIETFPGDYILYRLNCYRNNIHKKEFDELEWRLTFGDKKYEEQGHNNNENGWYSVN